MHNLPSVQLFFLCDQIVQHEDRQIDITGLLTAILFTDAAPTMQPSHIAANLVLGIHSVDRFRAYALRVEIHAPDGDNAILIDRQIGFMNGEYSPVTTETFDFTFPMPGTYWFIAYLDDRLAGRYPLAVEYVSMSSS